MKKFLQLGTIATCIGLVYNLLVRGALAPNLNLGRRSRKLGPISHHVQATPEEIFDVIAGPYLNRTPQALKSELNVLERGSTMVLAEHYTKTAFGITATTTETVSFDRPKAIHFRLVRGPVPSVQETFSFIPSASGTEFRYVGSMETDLWAIGSWWGTIVSRTWERTVTKSMLKITVEAERRAATR